jgi:glycosyltransferase involved in cell wall biosynthesis
VDFTIVTPSFRQLDWLACCIASVADQEGATIEHIVQDAGTEGFEEFAGKMKKTWPDRPGYRRVMISEPDQGMYDAVNKGLKKGTGRLCAYLNCDEQYLPWTLARIKEEFEKKPAIEILYGGFLVVDSHGKLVTAQRPVKMFWQHVATSHLPNFTCATFFLRAMLERDQAWFDRRYKYCGDQKWTIQRLRAPTPCGQLPGLVGVFYAHDKNAGMRPEGLAEARRIKEETPTWVRQFSLAWKWLHRFVKLFSGKYFPIEVNTLIFSKAELYCRSIVVCGWASPIWLSRLFAARVSKERFLKQ